MSEHPEPTAPTDTKMCKFPGCHREPAQKRGPGRKAGFCDDPDHNKTTAFHERKRRERQEAAEQGQPEPDEQQAPAYDYASARVRDLLPAAASLAAQLRAHMDEVTAQLATLSDPDAAAAQVERINEESTTALEAARHAQETAESERDAEAEKRTEADEIAEEAIEEAEQLRATLREFARRSLHRRQLARDSLKTANEETAAARAEAKAAEEKARKGIAEAQQQANRDVEEIKAKAAQQISTVHSAADDRVRAAQHKEAEAEAKALRLEGRIQGLKEAHTQLEKEHQEYQQRAEKWRADLSEQLTRMSQSAAAEGKRYEAALKAAHDRADDADKQAAKAGKARNEAVEEAAEAIKERNKTVEDAKQLRAELAAEREARHERSAHDLQEATEPPAPEQSGRRAARRAQK